MPTAPPALPRSARLSEAPRRVGELLGRSVLPLVTLTLLAATPWFGPWGLLVAALCAWRAAGRFL